MMTLEKIQKGVERIRAMAGDDEGAHSAEDSLRHEFILAVSKRAPEPFRTMAKEVLKTSDIEFARWCA